ncbi:MAG: hypothetical protein HZA12_04905 [Nitrospirae bacterium]|nr:hypothetical protein [Nitrospirota bacterium]
MIIYLITSMRSSDIFYPIERKASPFRGRMDSAGETAAQCRYLACVWGLLLLDVLANHTVLAYVF